MRADRQVTLRLREQGDYNPATGSKAEKISNELLVVANVSTTGQEQQMFLYGKAEQEAITIRLNFRLAVKVNEAEIDGKFYLIQRAVVYRHKTVLNAVRR